MKMRMITDDSGHDLVVPRGTFRGRASTRDKMMTFHDAIALTGMSDHPGKPLGGSFPMADYSFRTHDGATQMVSGRTCDSTGAFFVGELERLDMTYHGPLAAVFWGRDIDLREDVTVADEVSSFTVSTFASAGGLGNSQKVPGGIAWAGKNTNQITGIAVDIGKVTQPLRPWAQELKYDILELESAARLGRPVDAQKYAGILLKHQMDIDQQVNIGNTDTNDLGLVNSDTRTGSDAITAVANLPNGAAGFPQWTQKSPAEILADVNTALQTTWANSAWAVLPGRIMMPPAQFSYISTQLVSIAGNTSILKYVLENNIVNAAGGKLEILPLKWCIGSGVGGTVTVTGTVDRMVVYSKEKNFIRYPLTGLQRTPVQWDSLWQKTVYYNRLGVLEIVYPETVSYWDGL
jgi:hypothetical protein